MKSRKLILSAVLLTALIVGAVGILTYNANADITAKVTFKPNDYDLGNPPPNPWIVVIQLKGGYKGTDINESTLLLSGLFKPSGPGYPAQGPKWAVPFNGYDVRTAILMNAGHMAPGAGILVSLTVTGFTKSNTAFSGTGYIWVTDPPLPPP